MTVILGFAAMSVDASLMRLAQGHVQAVADASALSALQVYRETGDTTSASNAAQAIATLNPIVGAPGNVSTIQFGTWDPTGAGDKFTVDPTSVNAIRLSVNRPGIDTMFGKFFGVLNFDVTGGSTTAAQSLHVILVTDITGSWDKDDFAFVRQASVNFLDYLHANHGPSDAVGHVVFLQQYGWILSEMTNVDASASDSSLVRDQWSGLSAQGYAGVPMPAWNAVGQKHVSCKVFGVKSANKVVGPVSAYNYCPASCTANPNQTPLCDNCYSNDNAAYNPSCQSSGTSPFASPGFYSSGSQNSYFQATLRDNFTTCGLDTNGDGVINTWDCQCAGPDATGFKGMPLYFSDEAGTDHTTGMSAAQILLNEMKTGTGVSGAFKDPLAYTAVVILTDGQPSAYTYNANSRRNLAGLPEQYRMYARGSSHSVAQIQADMQVQAAALHAAYDANIWFVSFVEDHSYFANVAQGDGWYEVAASASDVTDIYDKIAKSLPQTLVE